MSTNNQNFGCAVSFTILITFPIFFVTFCIARNEIKERFIYGDIVRSIVLKKGNYSSTTKGGPGIDYHIFELKPIDMYTDFILEARGESKKSVIREISVGDTLTIKIQTERQARIISAKGNKINDENSYFWLFAMPFILFLGVFPYYILLKNASVKYLSTIIKFMIITILISFAVALFFTY